MLLRSTNSFEKYSVELMFNETKGRIVSSSVQLVSVVQAVLL